MSASLVLLLVLNSFRVERIPQPPSPQEVVSQAPPVRNGLFQVGMVGSMGATGPVSEIYAPHAFASYGVGVRLSHWGMAGTVSLGALVKRDVERPTDLYLTVGDVSLHAGAFWDFGRLSVALMGGAGAAVIQDPHSDVTVAGPSLSVVGFLGFRISRTMSTGLWLRVMHLMMPTEEETIEFWGPRSSTLYLLPPSSVYGHVAFLGISLLWY